MGDLVANLAIAAGVNDLLRGSLVDAAEVLAHDQQVKIGEQLGPHGRGGEQRAPCLDGADLQEQPQAPAQLVYVSTTAGPVENRATATEYIGAELQGLLGQRAAEDPLGLAPNWTRMGLDAHRPPPGAFQRVQNGERRAGHLRAHTLPRNHAEQRYDS